MSGIPQGGEISVNSTTTGTQTTNAEVFGVDYTPRAIASDAQGNFVVTWTSAGQDGDRNGVYARLYDSNGTPLAAEFQVNTTTLDNQENAVVAMDEDGDFVIAWQGDGGYGIYAQRYNSAGVAQGGEIQVAGDGFAATEIPSIAIDPDSGEFVVAWVADGFGSIRAQRYDSSGNPIGGEIAVSTAPNVKGKASIAMDQNGNFVVVWESDGQDGSNTGIYGRRFDSSGNPLGAEFLINNTTTGRQQSPSVAMDQDGNFVVAWETENQDGSAFGIYARRYDSSGAALEDEFQVNLSFYPGDRSGISPIQNGNQRKPIVTYEQDGDSFAIAWTDDDSGISETAVKRFNEFGTAQGVDIIANVNTTGNKTAPSIAIDSESDFVAVWTSLNGNATEDIYARRFGRTAVDAPTDIDLTSSLDNTIVPNTRIEISEATTAGTVIAIITGTDAETLPANLTFSLVDAADFDASDFAIINGNELQLTDTPDADTQALYRINLRATDEDGGTYDEIFEIFLGDISDEAPTDIELSNDTVDEASPSGTVVATLTAVDPDVSDTTFIFRLVSGPGSTDNGVFSIAPGSNELVLNEVPDFETKQSYDIRIEVEDTSGLTYQEEVTISVNDLEDPTDIELSNDTITENSTDLTIGTLSATDPTPSDTFTFTLVAGDGDDDNADFTIVGNELSINTSPDFETQSSYSIRVRVTDASSLSYEEVFTITVADQEFEIAPSNITLDGDSMEDAIAENQPIGTVVGILAADDPELPPNSTDALTFTLAAGVADNDLFQIGGANGDELQLNFVPDFETQNSYTVEVIATDAGGNESAPQTFTINILDVEFELPPTDITLDNTAIDENATNPVVGILSADDPELPGDTVTFSLPNGFGDNDDFTIVGTELRFVGTPDFETQNSYSVQILATDLGGNTYSEDFTITVNNLFEVAPDDIALSNDTIAENSTDLTIGTLTATDSEFAEGDDTFIFSLLAGVDDNDLFTITGDVLSINASPDFETQASYTLQIQVEDEGGNTFQETFTITVTNEFDIPPSALALDNNTVDENQPVGTVVGNLSATDPEIPQGDSLTFSLPAGVSDNDLFQIGGVNGDELQLNFVPDFETQNSYTVEVAVTDTGGNEIAQSFTITIGDVDPESFLPPTDITLDNTAIDENVANPVVGTLSADDPEPGDTVTFSLPNGFGDNDDFTIVGTELRFVGTPDFETQNSYSVQILATDLGGNTYSEDFTITVNNLFEVAPDDIALSNDTIAENSTDLTIGTLTATDSEFAEGDDTFIFSLLAGVDDNDLFTITGDVLSINASPDFETQASYTLQIQVEDEGGNTFQETFTITVTNEFDIPPSALALDNNTVDENQPVGTVVGNLSATDPEIPQGDSLTFSLPAGVSDNDLFQIGGVNGDELQLNFVPDFETQNSYTVEVAVTDTGGNEIAQSFTITIGDVDPESFLPPTDITLDNTAIDENVANPVVGSLSADDPEPGDTVTFSLPNGFGDNDDFTIVGNELRFVGTPDFETQNSYSVQILATDLGGNTYSEDFTITVNNLFEVAPTDIALSNDIIAENSTDLTIGTLTATDPEFAEGDDTFIFSLPAGVDDNDLFTITGDVLSINASPDFETQASYTLQIQVEDEGGNTFQETFTITVTNEFDIPPSALALDNNTVDENQPVGTVVGNLSATDPEIPQGDSLTFSLPAGVADNDLFQIGGVNGDELQLNFVPDFETQNSYTVEVAVTDTGGNEIAQSFTITIGDVDPESFLPPTDITLDNTAIDENVANPVVGTLSADDPEPGDTVTFSLPNGFGDNDDFTIVGTELRFVGTPDFETQNSYSIQILATDLGGNTYSEDFTITVNNLFEVAPNDIALSNDIIAENSTDLAIGTLTATDPEFAEGDDIFIFSLPAGVDDNDLFTITGDVLSINASPDFETQASYTLQIQVEDEGGNTFQETFTITVTNEFDIPPSALALDNNTVDENQPVGTVVGNLSATDPEIPQGDSLTFSLPAGVADNDLFQIGGVNGDELQLNFVPDFETQNSYTVEVAVTDAGGNEIAQSFTITIGDVDPESFLPPTDITLDNTAIDENVANPVVGSLSADDPEPGDTVTFSLPNGFGDNDDFTIVGNELRFVGTPDFETQNSYSVQILATDLGGNTYSEDFTITVNNLFEVAPTDIALSNDIIAENSTDLTIGTLTATDPEFAEGDDTFIFSLPAGVDDNDLFTITGDVLSINASPDFETQASYTLQIQVEDEGGNTFQETFTITVTDEFDIAPTSVALDNNTVDENRPVGTVVGNLSATDPEISQGDSLTFSLPAGVDDNDLFQIGGANGDELQLNFVPDFETQNSYTVQVVATDAAGNASAPQTFTINIGDIDPESILPPTDILLSANRIDENVAPGTTIGTLTAVDPDDTTGFTFSKIDTPGFDNDAFTVDGNELKIAISPDFEGKTLYRVRLQVADSTGNDFQKDFLITVNDLPENREPTDIVLTSTAIIEESPAGSTVGSLITTDPDLGDTFTYTLVDEPGLDTASFTITNNQLTINDIPDFETQSSYRIKIRSTDAGGLFREEFFDILVLNTQENNPPTSLSLTGASVAENSSEGTVIGSFIGVDPDPGDNLTYTFVAGAGDADNDLFQIQGNQLRILESPDFERQELYTIRVQGRDRQGNTIEEAFTISVLDQPESEPGTSSPILDLNGNDPGVNFAKSFTTDEPTTLMSPNATLTDPDSTNLVSAAVVISNPLDTPSEILEVDTSGTNIRAEYNTTGVLNLIGNAPLADYLQVLKTVTYLNLASFETDEPRSLVFVLDDGVNTNEVASTELTPIIDNSVSGTNGDDPSLETTPRTDIINANGGDDTITSIYENLLQQDEIDAGDGFDRFRLTNGSGSLFVDVTGGNQVSGISPTTIISNFEEFDFTGFQGTVQMTGGDAQVDRFIGGNGNDTLFGLDQGDFLSGGLGNDILDGGKGDDTLNGDAGNDLLTGGEGTDLLRGGTGNDSYVVTTTNGVISEDAGEGIDQVQASIGFTLPENVENLLLQGNASQGVGNASRNRIRGNSSNNRLFGSGGNDVLISLGGNDRLVGGAGNDRLLGGGDDDLLKGVGGDDRLIGGAGNDRLLGGGGNDLIKGIGGSDRLVGNAGNDRLLGGAGNDRLLGGGGNDRLVGNAGRNILIGNAGSDRFILGQPGSFNRVKDFNAEQNDKLVLIGPLSFGDVTLSQQGANTVVFLDNNRIALIEGIAANTLTASNFV